MTVDSILSVLGTLAGALMGWGLSEFSKKRAARPNVVFGLCGTPEDELTEKEFRTKTSLSEFTLEIFNLGTSPVVLQGFDLSYKRSFITDCSLDEKDRVILPFHSIKYSFMEQETKEILRCAYENNTDECTVTAYCLSGNQGLRRKTIKGKLDISWPHLISTFQRDEPC